MSKTSYNFALANDEAYQAVEHFGNGIVEAYKTAASWGSLGICAFGMTAYASQIANYVSNDDSPITLDLLAPATTSVGELISTVLDSAMTSPVNMVTETAESMTHARLAAFRVLEELF
ncbi:MAG: hypothetical protein K0R02_260 [Rickettsiaceae bacterium]|jgi:hypothetical protein|nr:hypothetical protein [Rickettsiaceae bacterium]